MHCDSGGGAEAFFGGGTKLTVLGKKVVLILFRNDFLHICPNIKLAKG